MKTISYRDFEKSYSSDPPSTNYLFTGDQHYLVEKALGALKLHLLGKPSDLNLHVFEGKSDSIRDVIAVANTVPMLAEQKLIVVNGFHKYSDTDRKAMEGYLSAPSEFTCVVLIAESIKKLKLKNTKTLVAVDFSLSIKITEASIVSLAKKIGVQITPDAAGTILDYLGENLHDINKELNKIALYSNRKKTITAQDIHDFIDRNQQQDVFQLIKALSSSDKKSAYYALLDLESSGEDELSILSRIAWRFRLLWKVKELESKKTPKNEILKELKISSGMYYYVSKESKLLGLGDLGRYISIFKRCDSRIKSTGLPANLTLSKMIMDLC